MPERQATRIPRVPLRTQMFYEHDELKLHHDWMIFFQQLANRMFGWSEEGAPSPEEAVAADFRHVIGWDLQDCAVGEDVSDPVIPVVGGRISACWIRIKVTDAANPLEIDIRKNGPDTSIFATLPLIAAGTTTRDVQEFTDFADDLIEAQEDLVLDIVQGGDWQVAVYLVYDAVIDATITQMVVEVVVSNA